MAATTMMHIRVDEDLKARAAATLDELGLSVSDAVRMFLKRVVAEEGLPLTLKVPNGRTRAAIAEAGALARPRFADVEDLIDAVEDRCRRRRRGEREGRTFRAEVTTRRPSSRIGNG